MRITTFFVLAVVLVFQAGCGNRGPARPSDLPKLHPVNITITQGGAPLPGANVNLMSKTPQAYSSASAVTGDTGEAALRTYGFNGVPEGQYTVTVTKTAIEGATEQMQGDRSVLVGGKIYQYVEALYHEVETSPLTIEIKPGTTNETFDVGAAVKEFIGDND